MTDRPAGDGSTEPEAPEGPFELDRYECVLLLRSEPTNRSDEDRDRLQAEHMAYLQSMEAAGHLRLCGPFSEQSDESMRGLALYQTGSIERARELASADPAVVAGELHVDVMYFYCSKGSI